MLLFHSPNHKAEVHKLWNTVRFVAFTALSIEIAVFWNMTACRLEIFYQRFHMQDRIVKMEAVGFSETLVSI
jgi:hypothetical protein